MAEVTWGQANSPDQSVSWSDSITHRVDGDYIVWAHTFTDFDQFHVTKIEIPVVKVVSSASMWFEIRRNVVNGTSQGEIVDTSDVLAWVDISSASGSFNNGATAFEFTSPITLAKDTEYTFFFVGSGNDDAASCGQSNYTPAGTKYNAYKPYTNLTQATGNVLNARITYEEVIGGATSTTNLNLLTLKA